MTKDNLMFAIIGLLLGFIIGFMMHSILSQREAAPRAATPQTQAMPPNHPPVGGDQGGDPQQVFAQVQQQLGKARNEPNNFEAQIEASRLEYQIQKYDSAIEFLLKANQIQPNNYETIATLGMVNMH